MALEKPWTSFVEPVPGREYLALVTYLPVGRWRAMPAFVRYAVGSVRQLSRSEGIVGYTLRALPLRRQFWTLTVWEDQGALAQYVGRQPHRSAMRWLRSSGMRDFVSTRWMVAPHAVPPSWDDALARLRS